MGKSTEKWTPKIKEQRKIGHSIRIQTDIDDTRIKAIRMMSNKNKNIDKITILKINEYRQK